jgi:hypothetical protein
VARLWLALQVAGGAVLAAGAAMFLFPGLSGAATGCGSLPSDNNVYLDCAIPNSSSPFTSYTDSLQINIAMGANSTFSPNDALGGEVIAIECAYNGSNPTDFSNQCSAQTSDGNWPIAVNANGSFDFSGATGGHKQPVYGLPDNTFPAATIQCDTTHACVWWIGEDPNGGFTSGPHVFSHPFTVTGGGVTTTTTAPTTTTTTQAGGGTTTTSTTTTTTQVGGDTTTTTTTVAGGDTTTTTTIAGGGTGGSTDSSSGSGTDSGTSPTPAASATLAFTGVPPNLLWFLLWGGVLFIVGTIGRRRTVAAAKT